MPQEIILLTDVPGLGQIGDQKKVKDGYATNYLIPRKLAVVSTPNMAKKFQLQKEKISSEKNRLIEKAKELADRVSKVGLVFERPVGQNGRLFGAVTHLDIATEFSQHGATVEKRSILMNGPIKTPGLHNIRVRLHSQVIVDIPVNVNGISVNREEEEADEVFEKHEKRASREEREEEDVQEDKKEMKVKGEKKEKKVKKVKKTKKEEITEE